MITKIFFRLYWYFRLVIDRCGVKNRTDRGGRSYQSFLQIISLQNLIVDRINKYKLCIILGQFYSAPALRCHDLDCMWGLWCDALLHYFSINSVVAWIVSCLLLPPTQTSDVSSLKLPAGRDKYYERLYCDHPSQHTKVFIRVTIYCSSRLRMRMKNHLFVQPVCPGPNYPHSIIITCLQIPTPFIYQYIYSLSVFSDSPVKTLCWDKEREETFLSLPSLSPCLHSPDSAGLYSQYQTWFELNLMLLPAQVFEKSFLNSISGLSKMLCRNDILLTQWRNGNM